MFTSIYNDELKRLSKEYGEKAKGMISLSTIEKDLGRNSNQQSNVGNSIDYSI